MNRLNKKKKFGRIRKIQKSDSDTDSEREIVYRLAEKVNSVASKSKTPVAKLAINSIPTRLTVDSGVRLTILNWSDWLRISHTGVKPVATTRTFVPYGIDTKLPIYARGKVTIQSKRGAVIQTHVYIMEDAEAESLLGRDDAIRLGIIKLDMEGNSKAKLIKEQVNKLKLQRLAPIILGEPFSAGRNQWEVDQDMAVIKKEYEGMFKGLGKVKDVRVDINLKPGAKPKIQAARPVLLHYL